MEPFKRCCLCNPELPSISVVSAAIVLGGSGKDHIARTILLGHSVSWTVKQHATMPVVLIGPREVPTEIPDIAHRRLESELPSLARHDVIASAA